MVSEAATDDGTVSRRDQLAAFVDAVDDVPGTYARLNGFGPDGSYATVNVDFDYGDRDQYGNGNVAVARDADDPIGREAFDRDLRIVRVVPQPSDDRYKVWVAHADDYEDATVDAAVTSLLTAAETRDRRQVVAEIAFEAFGFDAVNRCLKGAGFDPSDHGFGDE